ncbi:MAG: hypothetical protein ACI9S9_005083, partial [Planctomycetota bacterium]
MMTVGWILNLDADLELADPSGFTPTGRLVQQINVLADRLLVAANGAEKAVRHIRLAPGNHTATCQAWCPTPRAQAAARVMGHELPAMPPLPVIQQVNHRAFAAGFGLGLSGAA